VRAEDVVDTVAGYTYDRGNQNPASKEWGREARPGTAQFYNYPRCAGGRVIADVVRFDKGHTEGLEPRIVEEIVKLMIAASGGKISGG
jgi:hypothetical protein